MFAKQKKENALMITTFMELRIFWNSQQMELSKELDEATEPVRRKAVIC